MGVSQKPKSIYRRDRKEITQKGAKNHTLVVLLSVLCSNFAHFAVNTDFYDTTIKTTLK